MFLHTETTTIFQHCQPQTIPFSLSLPSSLQSPEKVMYTQLQMEIMLPQLEPLHFYNVDSNMLITTKSNHKVVLLPEW